MLLMDVRNFIISLGLALPFCSFGQSISPLPERIVAKDHGKAKSYMVAADEMARKQVDGHFQVVTENVT